MENGKDFVAPERIQVIIPYSDLEKMVKVVQEVEEIKRTQVRIEEQYTAIQNMFSQCLEAIHEYSKLVKD